VRLPGLAPDHHHHHHQVNQEDDVTKTTTKQCKGLPAYGIEPHEAPVALFTADKSKKDGLWTECKPHANAYQAAWRAKKAGGDHAAQVAAVEAYLDGTKAQAVPAVRAMAAASQGKRPARPSELAMAAAAKDPEYQVTLEARGPAVRRTRQVSAVLEPAQEPVTPVDPSTGESTSATEARRRFELALELSSPAMQSTILEARGAAQAKLVEETLEGIDPTELQRMRKRLQKRAERARKAANPIEGNMTRMLAKASL
jgi:hypothetical protein